jgi:hypothetical protein
MEQNMSFPQLSAHRTALCTLAVFLPVALTLGSTATAQAPNETKLTAFDAEDNDYFGTVAIDGDTLLVGARHDASRSAYVFVRSGTGWALQDQLTVSSASAFGASVALSGDTAVVGGFDGFLYTNSAFVFVRSGTTWSLEAELIPNDSARDFAHSVALSGDTAIIGAPGTGRPEGNRFGAAYVFSRSGTTWTQTAKLTASDGMQGDKFGFSVALSEDTAIFGAVEDFPHAGPGSAYVFVGSGANWSQQAKLLPSNGEAYDWFGGSVALSGDTALVGSKLDWSPKKNSGSAHVFVRSGTTWSQQAKLTASDALENDWFGTSVALSGDGHTALVGAEKAKLLNSAYLFRRTGTTWSQDARLTASDGVGGDGSRFGWSVSMSQDGSRAVVGAPWDKGENPEGFRRGSVYVYDLGGTAPPTADAGSDFSVNECQLSVMLDGSGSSDLDGDPLSYAWAQIAGTVVVLSDPTAAQPTFDAPLVAFGGETLSFELTVTAAGESAVDTVSVTVVNVNHPPVADPGDDLTVAEGSPVTLHGEDSFDIDNDPFSHSWVQVSGSPTVTLIGAGTANPSFTAPVVGGNGAPGVVTTLVFELTVDDGFPPDAPAPGYTFGDAVGSVAVDITNVNNDPIAAAGADQTVDENGTVTLDGSTSSDPDDDMLSYAWTQIGGTGVAITDQFTAMPSFSAPFVSAGGEDFTFELAVYDGFGGSATDTVVVHVLNANDPPLVSAATPTIETLWPPNHGLVQVGITGVSDPDSNATITIDCVTQDEPTSGTGDGDTAIDAIISADGTVLLRAERSGGGNGRVYHIHFTASDLEGSASGVVTVGVSHKKKTAAIDDGELHDSTH